MKVRSLFFLFVLASSFCLAKQSKIDSLQSVVDKNKQDTNHVKALVMLSALIRNSDMDKAMKLSLEAIPLSTKLSFKKGIGLANLNIGTINHLKGNYDTALVYYNTALSIFSELKLKKNISKCHNNMGNLFQLRADYSKAIEHLIACKRIAEELKDDKMLSDCELNIGNVYLQKKEFVNAIKQYTISLKIANKINDLSNQAQAYNNTGAAQRYLNKNDSALINYKRSLAIRYQLNDLVGISENVMNIGDTYFYVPQYDSALHYFNRSYKLYNEIGHKMGMLYSMNNIGTTLYKLNKTDLALDTLLKVVQLSTALGARDLKVEAYKNIAEIYYAKGRYKESADYRADLAALKDSLLNESSNKQITEMQTKYETEKKDKEIIKQNAEIKNQQIEADKKAIERNALIIGIVLMLALALFILRGYKQKQKANKLITLQKEEVERQKEVVEFKNEIIEEKQKEIIDSINYAKRIQYTLLAHADFLKENLPEHFVFFNPKDIVSGDFYWATRKDNLFYLAVCDSTGHGVPGAFMSLLNIGFLSEAINEKNILAPNEVFNYVRQRLTDSVSKDGQKDGFDGILVCFNSITKTITYASAHNAPVIVRGGELIEMEADKMPVGVGERKQDFSLRNIEYKEGDTLYLYTDGYADQFGGPKGKKFKYKALNELIVSVSTQEAKVQKEKLHATFEEWRGDLEQVDDVLVIGIKL